MTLAALVKLDRESERALDEAATAETRIDVEAVGFALAQLIEPGRLRAVVECVRHACLLQRMKYARRWTPVLGGFPIEALDVSFAVFGIFIGMKTVEQILAVIIVAGRSTNHRFRNFARDTLGIVAFVAVVQ